MKTILVLAVLFLTTPLLAKKNKKIETVEEYKNHVQDFVINKRKTLKSCEKGLKLKGRMVVYWEIGDDGKATDFSRGKDTIENDEVYHCFEKAISSWKFGSPPEGKVVEIEHEFYFK